MAQDDPSIRLSRYCFPLLATIVVFSCAYSIVPYYTMPAPFDSALWKASRVRRTLMVDDLLASGEIIGRSALEVHEMLGHADKKRSSDDLSTYQVRYILRDHLVSYSAMVLVVEDGQVVDAYIEKAG